MDDIRLTRRVTVQLSDPMRHFSREGPVTKLVALLICKLPALIASTGAVIAAVLKVFGWW